MAIYHLHVKVIGRKSGSSAVASAAYRSGSRLRDERLDRSHDFSAKRGVVHSEVMLPENAPEAWSDRERLWNNVEAFEVRKDAQLAREVEFALPREMTQAQGIELARDFVQAEFADQGMIADLNVHWDIGEDGMPKPHAHIMLTMRAVDENGFGQKVREWNRTEMVERWRERWAELANERLAELDIDARIDHRSLEAQGVALEPQSQIGASAKRIEDQGIEGEGTEADRAEMHREIARGNGARIIADPSVALDAITHQQSTFTQRDIAKFAHRHSDGLDQFNEVMGVMRNAPDLVELGKDARGEDRFTTREMIEAEQRLHRAAELMAERERHEMRGADREAALARAERSGLVLSGEQADALAHITDGRDLGIVVGYAGAGNGGVMYIKSIALACAALGALYSTSASADIVTLTFTGTVTGIDYAGYFGYNTNGSTFTATYVFDSNLSGSNRITTSVYSDTNGGSAFSIPTPAISATLEINGLTFSTGGLYSSEFYSQNTATSGYFESYGSVSPTAGSRLSNYIFTADPNAPVLTSLTTPFSYTLNTGYYNQIYSLFQYGADNLNLYSYHVTNEVSAVPEPSTWAMLLLGFAGIGAMTYRRRKAIAA
jgi:hypothetical protein